MLKPAAEAEFGLSVAQPVRKTADVPAFGPSSTLLSESIWLQDWRALREGLPAQTKRPLTSSYDVAIVGAGLTGLTTALRLAQAGRSVIVLEAESAGSGASLRNAGFCTSSAPFSVKAAIKRHGVERGQELLRWFFGGPDQVRALLGELGEKDVLEDAARLVLADTAMQAQQLRAECDALNEVLAPRGRKLEYLPGEALREHIGFGEFQGALRDPMSACVNPARLVAALLHACEGLGVRLLEQTRVSRIKAAPSGADGWRLQHTRGELTAARVVLATNGYSTGLGVGSNRLVVPVGSYIIASHPLEPHVVQQFGARPTVFSTSGRFPNYFRLVTDAVTGSARLLFGGRRSLSYESSPQRVASELLEDVRRVLPSVPFNVERVWGGRLAFTAHREPQMGEIERGLYFVGGCCGHGVPTSIACANALASVLLEKADAPPIFYSRKLSRSFAIAAASKLLPLIGTYYRARDRLDSLQVTR